MLCHSYYFVSLSRLLLIVSPQKLRPIVGILVSSEQIAEEASIFAHVFELLCCLRGLKLD